MLIVRATKKLLARIGPADVNGEESTTLLGPWYATALPWRPQTALLVNELTLLPVLIPLAPTATLLDRVGDHIATVLAAHAAPDTIIQHEQRQMDEHRVTNTANRSVVGIMTEFTHLATVYRDNDPDQSLLDTSLRLAETPCSPLYRKNVSPDRELAALLQSTTRPQPAQDRRILRLQPKAPTWNETAHRPEH